MGTGESQREESSGDSFVHLQNSALSTDLFSEEQVQQSLQQAPLLHGSTSSSSALDTSVGVAAPGPSGPVGGLSLPSITSLLTKLLPGSGRKETTELSQEHQRMVDTFSKFEEFSRTRTPEERMKFVEDLLKTSLPRIKEYVDFRVDPVEDRTNALWDWSNKISVYLNTETKKTPENVKKVESLLAEEKKQGQQVRKLTEQLRSQVEHLSKEIRRQSTELDNANQAVFDLRLEWRNWCQEDYQSAGSIAADEELTGALGEPPGIKTPDLQSERNGTARAPARVLLADQRQSVFGTPQREFDRESNGSHHSQTSVRERISQWPPGKRTVLGDRTAGPSPTGQAVENHPPGARPERFRISDAASLESENRSLGGIFSGPVLVPARNGAETNVAGAGSSQPADLLGGDEQTQFAMPGLASWKLISELPKLEMLEDDDAWKKSIALKNWVQCTSLTLKGTNFAFGSYFESLYLEVRGIFDQNSQVYETARNQLLAVEEKNKLMDAKLLMLIMKFLPERVKEVALRENALRNAGDLILAILGYVIPGGDVEVNQLLEFARNPV